MLPGIKRKYSDPPPRRDSRIAAAARARSVPLLGATFAVTTAPTVPRARNGTVALTKLPDGIALGSTKARIAADERIAIDRGDSPGCGVRTVLGQSSRSATDGSVVTTSTSGR